MQVLSDKFPFRFVIPLLLFPNSAVAEQWASSLSRLLSVACSQITSGANHLPPQTTVASPDSHTPGSFLCSPGHWWALSKLHNRLHCFFVSPWWLLLMLHQLGWGAGSAQQPGFYVSYFWSPKSSDLSSLPWNLCRDSCLGPHLCRRMWLQQRSSASRAQ